MEKGKLFAGIILFGSVWGLLECSVGDYLHEINFLAGPIMTGLFGFGLMMVARMLYQQQGMQMGMALVAGVLRYFHPIGGCLICSAIAIVCEGVIFEIIWYHSSLWPDKMKSMRMKISMGIISGYLLYVLGYIGSQLITPLTVTMIPNAGDILGILPRVLSDATFSALLGGITLPAVLTIPASTTYIVKMRKEVYYPISSVITFLCIFFILS
ncbi:MAG: hypothetical protein DRN29_06535 [Thermoplasmata archaeon]|nr:MAG: hypothetical protein DRN29_06535 [Thermoplasmata archaeon]